MAVRHSSRIGIVDRSAILSAEFSHSCVDVAMQSCNYDRHTRGHPITKMTKPVRLLTAPKHMEPLQMVIVVET
jgi:hypothetical protein